MTEAVGMTEETETETMKLLEIRIETVMLGREGSSYVLTVISLDIELLNVRSLRDQGKLIIYYIIERKYQEEI